MTKKTRMNMNAMLAVSLAVGLASFLVTASALAASASELRRNAAQALATLDQANPGARALAQKSKGILIFPSIVSGAFFVGAHYGDGVLREGGRTVAYYRSLQGSYGYQVGAQTYGYILFFMDNDSLNYLRNSQGWELGAGPTLVVMDKGFGKVMSTTTMKKGVYAFVFDQKGFMGGMGIKGSKITQIYPSG